jgi:hypothetical protein
MAKFYQERFPSRRVDGYLSKVLVVWQAPQSCEVVGCSRLGLPSAIRPLWQESQRPIASVWLILIGIHAVVRRWQFSQMLVVKG